MSWVELVEWLKFELSLILKFWKNTTINIKINYHYLKFKFLIPNTVEESKWEVSKKLSLLLLLKLVILKYVICFYNVIIMVLEISQISNIFSKVSPKIIKHFNIRICQILLEFSQNCYKFSNKILIFASKFLKNSSIWFIFFYKIY